MHIKSVAISGFKSYKDQNVLEAFSPHHNVIVGRNGSGKSNFFWAIRFVLGDAYTNMTREERQALLHEGSGPTTLSAFVEIVFDNSDGRFPTGKDEVVLRRTIGLKKDEYSLDRKSVTKADVMNLLESAGFSRSNPYYIVPQGRITSLTNAKDHERLALLKEVAGTRVYEQRRQESLKIMEETESKRKKIDELLAYIEERLEELEQEKEELKEFQEKDRERRSLEYTIYQRELDQIGEQIELLEEKRRELVEMGNNRQSDLSKREADLANLERDISRLEKSQTEKAQERREFEKERTVLIREKAHLEVLVKDMESSAVDNDERRKTLAAELKKLDGQIAKKEQDLAKLLPEWEKLKGEEQNLSDEGQKLDLQMEALLTKQNRSNQFATQADRDKHLKKEIKDLQKTIATQTTQKAELESDVVATKEALKNMEGEISAARATMEGRGASVEDLNRSILDLKRKRDQAMDARKALWRDEAKSNSQIENFKSDLEKAERDMAGAMNGATRSGLEIVNKIAKKHNLPGVYGALWELFDVDERYRTAVEVIAGQSLFHVVVDTDETAISVLDAMAKEKAGRVTFMPLNKLRPKTAEYPHAQDAIPMIKKLRFDPTYSKAFEQVFSKAIICPNLEVASAYARSAGLTAVTLDGDRADRKGALTGGFLDARKSKLETAKQLKTLRRQLEEEQAANRALKQRMEKINQEITQLGNDLTDLELKKQQLVGGRVPMQQELASKLKQEQNLQKLLQDQENALRELQAAIKAREVQLAAFESELASPMAAGLSAAEAKQIETMRKAKIETSDRLGTTLEKRTKVETQKNILEIEIRTKLRSRRDQVSGEIESLQIGDGVDGGGNGGIEDLNMKRADLEKAERDIRSVEKKLESLDKEIEVVRADLEQRRQAFETEKTAQVDEGRRAEQIKEELTKNMSKKSTLTQRKEEFTHKIRDLGVLPDDAYQKHTREQTSKLLAKLNKTRDALKKYEHVNKKALDQYNSFTQQRDQLNQRKEELDKSAEAITDLIKVLDQRKDEAIDRTFNTVRKYFAETFEKLEPKGRGQLLMLRRADNSAEQDDDDDDDEERDRSKVDQYTGVAIKVSFNSKVDEGLRNEQLSGGQKSLVALALIFAIQRCDPAPFYLFDEIDANLDPQYRTAVASMIHELSSKAQFITTTFRPEQLKYANKFYGVTFMNKVSKIQVITRDDAVAFVDENQAV
ncbi:putative chromosome segregation protein SudA [Hyaloraphidium curvatum]|nr:putative chromosome segregation protein SudA [Hyaloraphidium curvatum]